MHLLAAKPGGIADGSEAVDLGQSPGDIVVLSAADSELSALAAAHARLGDGVPSLRLASLLNLSHNLSVDLYVEAVIGHARLVVVRLLGGVSYWPYGVEQVVECCRRRDIALALVPGDDQPDPELAGLGLVAPEAGHRLWQYCVHGGPENAANFLAYAASLLGRPSEWREPAALLRAGLYWPGLAHPGLEDLEPHWRAAAPVAAIVFYRALFQAANLAPVDDLVAALAARGINPLPLYVTSLKDPLAAATLEALFARAAPEVVLNATGFAVSTPGAARAATPFDNADCPVLQVVFSGGTEEAWRAGSAGLSARDLAMNVALPEVDGRIFCRAVSFKAEERYDRATETALVRYQSVADRIDFTADLAAAWLALRRTPAGERRVAVVLANYPNRDGRIGNGVGLDTPAATMTLLRAMAAAGYHLEDLPNDGAALMARLIAGPTNATGAATRAAAETLSRADYLDFFGRLAPAARAAVSARWGAPERDPMFRARGQGDGVFAIPALRFGNVAVAVQPARGYNIDPAASYHDPDLVPPHNYLAFHAWMRRRFGAHAVVHMGKHGNLEWLPGKALALSQECWPEAALGPLPHLYPFIVNDPGEGTQAKRRAAAVIIDHLTPPLTRAESYGPLRDLEQLVDEYYQASGLDPRRLKVLSEQILELCASTGLDRDCGVAAGDDAETRLTKLDTYLCELKEMQIRDGLHVFGESPVGGLLDDLLLALVRLPRNSGKEGEASLLRALAADLGLAGFDPLDCEMGERWRGLRPEALREGPMWR
ncbi:MAG: cobaltochelatase subunit CobN, partial [Alphaproteobacteria bacterium]